MMTNRLLSAVPTLVIVLSCAAVPVWADRDDDRGWRAQPERPAEQREQPQRPTEKREQPQRPIERREQSQRPTEQRERAGRPTEQYQIQRRDNGRRDAVVKPPPGYVLDKRYRHDRYYPPRGYTVPSLPPDHRVISHRGVRYYYHGGVWYRHSGTYFIVVLPPFGLIVPFLPPFYTTIWVGGIPYYYADEIYYVWRPEQSAYVVAEPPPASEVNEEPATPDQLFVYPMRGQSEQQQATDRYQCHRWAVDQTGFDPTQPGGGVTEAEIASKRSDYQRAMKACLEARGYSVQ